jgi:hypothetical protein
MLIINNCHSKIKKRSKTMTEKCGCGCGAAAKPVKKEEKPVKKSGK